MASMNGHPCVASIGLKTCGLVGSRPRNDLCSSPWSNCLCVQWWISIGVVDLGRASHSHVLLTLQGATAMEPAMEPAVGGSTPLKNGLKEWQGS